MPNNSTKRCQPRLILAPLLGVTTAVFRRVFQQHFSGFDQAMGPFIAVTHGKLPPIKYFKDIWPQNNQTSIPLIPQLIGKDGHDFREMANRIQAEFGYNEINWNIGCPSPTVTSRVRGAGMLAHPDMIRDFLDAACLGLKCQLSIKMRLGMERPDEYLHLVEILNRYPICEITIHPRTGRQLYTGNADVERFADLQSRLSSPIVYNGDIRTSEHGLMIGQRFPQLSGLMIGRGAISNPLLPSLFQSGEITQKVPDLIRLQAFHDDLYQSYSESMEGGAGPILGKMKEIWTYWSAALGDSAVRHILKSKSLIEYELNVSRAFCQNNLATD